MRKGGEASSTQEIAWEGDSRWIPISAALLGEVGRMQVLTPSVLVHPAADNTSQVCCCCCVHKCQRSCTAMLVQNVCV